jgi:hypothetical protein
MDSYKENKKRKDGAKIQYCAAQYFAAFAYLRKLRLAPSIKRKVLSCTATKTTLITPTQGQKEMGRGCPSVDVIGFKVTPQLLVNRGV